MIQGKCSPMNGLHNVHMRSSSWDPLRCMSNMGPKGLLMDKGQAKANDGSMSVELSLVPDHGMRRV